MLNTHQTAVLETAGLRAGISCFQELLDFIREQYAERTAFSYTRNGVIGAFPFAVSVPSAHVQGNVSSRFLQSFVYLERCRGIDVVR